MKKTITINQAIGEILDRNLQLDMPRPTKAKMQVVREIIELFENKEKAVRAKYLEILNNMTNQDELLRDQIEQQPKSNLFTPRTIQRDIAVIYENFIKGSNERDIALLHGLYSRIYNMMDEPKIVEQVREAFEPIQIRQKEECQHLGVTIRFGIKQCIDCGKPL